MVGHKLGEFAPTRLFKGHAGADKAKEVSTNNPKMIFILNKRIMKMEAKAKTNRHKNDSKKTSQSNQRS